MIFVSTDYLSGTMQNFVGNTGADYSVPKCLGLTDAIVKQVAQGVITSMTHEICGSTGLLKLIHIEKPGEGISPAVNVSEPNKESPPKSAAVEQAAGKCASLISEKEQAQLAADAVNKLKNMDDASILRDIKSTAIQRARYTKESAEKEFNNSIDDTVGSARAKCAWISANEKWESLIQELTMDDKNIEELKGRYNFAWMRDSLANAQQWVTMKNTADKRVKKIDAQVEKAAKVAVGDILGEALSNRLIKKSLQDNSVATLSISKPLAAINLERNNLDKKEDKPIDKPVGCCFLPQWLLSIFIYLGAKVLELIDSIQKMVAKKG